MTRYSVLDSMASTTVKNEMVKTLQDEHPEWYHATDYRWLRNVKKPEPPDYTLWNRLDDIHRRDMASWAGGMEDDDLTL